MNAYAMVGPYVEDFNTADMANLISEHDFNELSTYTHSEIRLRTDQALYLYGGRQSLVTALDRLGKLKIVNDRRNLAVFRVSRRVAAGTKTKQLLMITQMSAMISATLRPLLIPKGETLGWNRITDEDLKGIIQKLPKR